MTETGIIYFLQPAELKETNRYKIGYSANPDLSRIKNYKKGSRYICIMECKNPLNLEKQIIKAFNDEFKLCAGNEYFEGDEQKMLLKFLELTTKHIVELTTKHMVELKDVEPHKMKEENEGIFKEEIYEFLLSKYKLDEDKKVDMTINNIVTEFYKNCYDSYDNNRFKIPHSIQWKIVENILLNDDRFKNNIEIINNRVHTFYAYE
jgi:hypothetical protein